MNEERIGLTEEGKALAAKLYEQEQ